MSAADLGRHARITFVFAGLAGLYPLGDFLADNSPRRIQRRYETENAAVIAALPERYVKNTYHLPDPADAETDDIGCPAVHVIPVAMPTARTSK
jgi:hypothetical protein